MHLNVSIRVSHLGEAVNTDRREGDLRRDHEISHTTVTARDHLNLHLTAYSVKQACSADQWEYLH